MRLPNIEEADIPEAKIRDYLLCSTHRVGKTKAAFFESFGFVSERWQELRDALLKHARDNEVQEWEDTEYGRRYVIDGPVWVPSGDSPRVRSVWFVEPGRRGPRFVTAHPLRRKRP